MIPDLPLKRILIVGPSRCGKDTACTFLARITRLRFAGSTSIYLAPFVAEKLGVSPEEALRTRHQNRNLWNRVGRAIRQTDPGYLVRRSLENAEIIGGIRDVRELKICQESKMIDLIIWIANKRSRTDTTLQFAEEDCDLTIPNHSDLAAFHARLYRFAIFSGLPLRSP